MKKNISKYPSVERLPKNALTVKNYADNNECSTSYIYKLVKEKKAKFKIVTFQTVNFIIP